MKKLIVVAAAAVGALVAKKRMDDSKHEQALWQEATDPITPAP